MSFLQVTIDNVRDFFPDTVYCYNQRWQRVLNSDVAHCAKRKSESSEISVGL